MQDLTLKIDNMSLDNPSPAAPPPAPDSGFIDTTPTTPSTSTPSNTPSKPPSPSTQPPTKQPSHISPYTHTQPPTTTQPYDPADALSDLPAVSYALQTFLSSRMIESEAYLEAQDGRGGGGVGGLGVGGLDGKVGKEEGKEGKGERGERGEMVRLYIATGYGLIQCVKGLMSYEDADLLAGIQHTKHGNHIASLHRKKASAFLGSRLAGSIVSSVSSALHAPGSPSALAHITAMSPVERHAELVYAESLFEKALLGIVYSGDWLAFVREALNMRATIGVYRGLGAWVEYMDDVYSKAQGRKGEDPSIDAHFRSGVLLGVGMCNIILSLMPGKLMALVELFGYKGDRKYGLECLMKAGGWSAPSHSARGGKDGKDDVNGKDKDDDNAREKDDNDDDEPAISAQNEGVRRSICDMALLIFHLVLSSFTFENVDIGVAERVLKWNLKRYPNGVFFLFGAGRLALVRSRPAQAIHFYTLAMQSQSQYRNLHHISFWEMAIAYLSLWEVEKSLECWRDLEREASWSKAIYSYGMAVCLIESAPNVKDEKEREKHLAEAKRLMERVPSLRQKIAGKSIPLEKLVSRKARKFLAQSHRLTLPALELAYIFQGIAHAPRAVIVNRMLPEVARVLEGLGWVDGCLGGGGGGEGGGGVREVTLADVSAASSAAAASGEKQGGKQGEKQGEKGTKKRSRKVIERLYPKEKGGGYWDDFCLAMFLRGVCLRYAAYPDPDADIDPTDSPSNSPTDSPTDSDALNSEPVPEPTLTKELAEREAQASFKAVFEHGPKIELDHQIVYHAHYELGRLHAAQSNPSLAKAQFELVLSGKPLEVGPSASARKGKGMGKGGKYSMENALHMRTCAALDAVDGSRGGRL